MKLFILCCALIACASAAPSDKCSASEYKQYMAYKVIQKLLVIFQFNNFNIIFLINRLNSIWQKLNNQRKIKNVSSGENP